MNKEEFDGYAYAYRAWPGSDPAGVVARFNELTAYVEGLIAEAIDQQRTKPCTADIDPLPESAQSLLHRKTDQQAEQGQCKIDQSMGLAWTQLVEAHHARTIREKQKEL